MINNLYLKSGELFATGFRRVVRGERGDYIEFEESQIAPLLVSYFDNIIPPKDSYYLWLTPIYKNKIIEDIDSSYSHRTYRNAIADVTLAFAIDFTTAGEKCTKNAALKNSQLFYEVQLGDVYKNLEEIIQGIRSIAVSNSLNLTKSISINIAGNGIYTLNKYNISQEEIDEEITFYIKVLNDCLNNRNIKIHLIRSGGQTGVDEAGSKAAIALGIPSLIVCPEGYKFKTVDKNIVDKEAFCSRFSVVDPEVKVYYQLKKVKYADYLPGFYYVSINEFKDFKDPEKLF